MSSRSSFLYGIENLTEGVDAHRHKVFWRDVHVGFLNDPLSRQEDAKFLAAACLCLESQNKQPGGLITELDLVPRTKEDSPSLASPRYLLLWTIKPDAPDPCRVHLMQDDDVCVDGEPNSFDARLTAYLMQFRADNAMGGDRSWVSNYCVVQTLESFEYAIAQLHEAIPSGLDTDEMQAIELQRERIEAVFEKSIPRSELHVPQKPEPFTLDPFLGVVEQQVRQYWSRLVKPRVKDLDSELLHASVFEP